MHMLINYSITIETLLSGLSVTLFPVISAPKAYKAGISRGKLNGDITATGP